MKYLGIDYGLKRIGLAISDDSGVFAFPLKVIKNSKNLIVEIRKLCSENEIGGIVVGESKNFKQEENEIMKDIKIFIKDLKEVLHLPISLHPEYLTSAEAERIQGKNDMLDASAAAIILRDYLDTRQNNK